MRLQRIFRGLLAILALAVFGPTPALAQGGVVVGGGGGGGSQPNYQFEWFYALNAAGEVYVLQIDTKTHELAQSNQPVWRQPGLVSIAAVYPDQVYGVTSDHRIYFADLSKYTSATVDLVSTNAPTDLAADRYFGCNSRLYTIRKDGVLVSRGVGSYGSDKLVSGLSAPTTVGHGWQHLSNVGCVNLAGFQGPDLIYGVNFQGAIGTFPKGALLAYVHDLADPKDWTTYDTHLNFAPRPPYFPGTPYYGWNSVLISRRQATPTGLDTPVQTYALSPNGDGLSFPSGVAYHGSLVGGPDLQGFVMVVFDKMSDRTIQ